MLMCNACGIYFKNHGRHRPVELAMAPPRVISMPRGAAAAAHAAAAAAAGAESDGEVEAVPQRRPRHAAALLPPSLAALESDLSEQVGACPVAGPADQVAACCCCLLPELADSPAAAAAAACVGRGRCARRGPERACPHPSCFTPAPHCSSPALLPAERGRRRAAALAAPPPRSAPGAGPGLLGPGRGGLRERDGWAARCAVLRFALSAGTLEGVHGAAAAALASILPHVPCKPPRQACPAAPLQAARSAATWCWMRQRRSACAQS